jgi:hypothetical protein
MRNLVAATFAILLLVPSCETAAEQMPAELLGEWCPVKTDPEGLPATVWRYKEKGRTHPPHDDICLTFTRGGFERQDVDCKLVKITTDPTTRVHRMQFRCEGKPPGGRS